MFVADSRILSLPLELASTRLESLVGDGGVTRSSQAAYAAGISGVIRVGPFGDIPGMTKLVRIQFLEPTHRDGVMTLAMRWEAVGPAGGFFPVLDADISLAREGEQATKLSLVGSYRPPLGWLGEGLDHALLRRVAMATIRALLRDIERSLARPGAPTPPPTG